MCLWIHMCACMCVHVEARGQPLMFLMAVHLIFGHKISHWGLTRTQGRLAGHWVPGSLLSLPPQFWDYKHAPPHATCKRADTNSTLDPPLSFFGAGFWSFLLPVRWPWPSSLASLCLSFLICKMNTWLYLLWRVPCRKHTHTKTNLLSAWLIGCVQ